MRNEEITEALQNATLDELNEDLAYANIVINRKALFPGQATAPRFLERKQEYREFRDQILAEIASRA